jgi:hypothetical protein
MNAISGVETTASCQDYHGLGYVEFQGLNAHAFACEMLMKASPPLETTGGIDKDYGYQFEMKFNGGSCRMRWSPASYWLVLDAAKQVAGRLRDGREREQVERSRGTT